MQYYGCAEFHEGVRAKIVDKDKKPNWKYKTIEDVQEEDIWRFFEKNPITEDKEEVYNIDKLPYI